MKEQFLLDPEIVFLNHGSFGACPRPVFNTYQRWQRKMEHQPVKFLGREMVSMMFQARTKLGEYLHCDPKDIVYFPNPTTVINMVVRSLGLKPGDEVIGVDCCRMVFSFLQKLWYPCPSS
jgi:isopenicillin-N epimerase